MESAENKPQYSKLTDRPFEGQTITGYDFLRQPPLLRARAIRAKCIECCAGAAWEVKRCHITDCALWPYRMGKGIQTKLYEEPEGTDDTEPGEE